MKRMRIPKLGTPARRAEPAGRHRAGGRKLTSKSGRHRAPEAVPPWSERDDYKGRHRKGETPPKGSTGGGRHRQTVPGKRLTPLEDRDRGYFSRR